ncbi:TPA: AAA family ATPase [Campylobacter jejuni]|nr:AAA family ATPase [Campylobacter jejuni]HEG8104654.1 AAA family ATPase [Campylobacter jejuni]HEG8134350.1 AAA family ATPase [Campylobacter jejuni]
MSKWLITGDVHIHNYKQYNNVTDRLQQYETLFRWIAEYSQLNSINHFIIAGDLFMVPSPPPVVVNMAKRCLNLVLDINPQLTIHLIPGNHDLDMKKLVNEGGIAEMDDYSLLKLLQDDKGNRIRLYHDEVVMIDNKSVHFHSWSPKGLTPRPADILVAHDEVTGSWYNKIYCQEGIDTSSYSLAFVGHVHNPQVIGNTYIPGVPIPTNLGDNQDCSLIVYDSSTGEVTRVPTGTSTHESDFTYMRFVKIKEGDTQPDGLVAVKVMDRYESKVEVDESTLNRDLERMAKELMKDEFTEEAKAILNEIIDTTPDEHNESINLDVELLSVKIHNFLSIHDAEIDLTGDWRVASIVGNNGTGKSTLFKFLYYMLTGSLPNTLKDEMITSGKKGFRGELNLRYNGCHYKIVRSRGETGKTSPIEFCIDDKPLTKNTSTEIETEIKSHLPFLKFINILFIFQESKGIFSEMSDSSRVSFLSNFIGLSRITNMTDRVNAKLNEHSLLLTSTKSECDNLRGKVESLQGYMDESLLDSLDDRLNQLSSDKSGIDREIVAKNLLIQEYDNITVDIRSLETEIYSLKSRLISPEVVAKYRGDLEKLNQELNIQGESKVKISSDLAQLELQLANLPSEVPVDTETYVSLQSQLMTTLNEINNLKGLISSTHTVCPTCGSPMNTSHLETHKKTLADLELVYQGQLQEFETHKLLVETLKAENDKVAKQRSDLLLSIDKVKYEQAQVDSRITKISSEMGEIQGFLDNKDKINGDINSKMSDIQAKLEEKTLKLNSIDRVSLSSDINLLNTKMNELMVEINRLTTMKKMKDDIVEYSRLLAEKEGVMNNLTKIVEDLTYYCKKILGDKGLLVAKVLQGLAEYLDSSELKVFTTKTLKNGNITPALDIALKVDTLGEYVPYGRLSGGQTLLADLYFLRGLTRLTRRIGFIFMDELFKFFDSDNILVASEVIRECDVGKMLLIIHDQSATSLADTTLQVTMDSNGSHYNFI